MSVTIANFSDSVLVTSLMILLASVPQNFSYFVDERGYIFLSMVLFKALKVP